ncbi:Polyadenylate-binding protein RBP47B [Capsicum chinense]|nr:Polyadenylate-binding protein RBP47B [Capsicum chinense]
MTPKSKENTRTYDNDSKELRDTKKVISVKVIRKKQTGQSECYGFVEFYIHEAAEKVLQSYNGTMRPNAEQPFRLNWSAFSTGEKRADAGAGSDLSFLFDDESERSLAMTEMNGIYCSGRAMRICVATPKKPSAMQQYSSQGGHASNGAATQTSQSDSHLSNTTVFVGGLDSDFTDAELRQSFSQFGNVVSVKIPAGKGCGFVQFSDRNSGDILVVLRVSFIWSDLIDPTKLPRSYNGAKISFAKGWSVEHPSPENDSVYRSNITLCAYELNVEHPQGAQQRMQYKNKMEQLLELRQFVFPGVEIQQTISDLSVPDPAERGISSDTGIAHGAYVVVGTFASKRAIIIQSPQRTIKAASPAREKGVLDVTSYLRRDDKRNRAEIPNSIPPYVLHYVGEVRRRLRSLKDARWDVPSPVKPSSSSRTRAVDLPPHGLYLKVRTLGHREEGLEYILQARLQRMESFFDGCLLHAQSPFSFSSSNRLPLNHVHLSLDTCGAPDEISLGPGNVVMNFARQETEVLPKGEGGGGLDPKMFFISALANSVRSSAKKSLLAFHLGKVADIRLDNNSIVREPNGSEVLKGGDIFTLRDKAVIGGINPGLHSMGGESLVTVCVVEVWRTSLLSSFAPGTASGSHGRYHADTSVKCHVKNTVNLSSQATPIATIENDLQNWSIPEESFNTIYQIGKFSFLKKHNIKTSESTIAINNSLEIIQLFNELDINRFKHQFNYLHVGLVQVAIKPLFRQGLDIPVCAILRDARLLNFDDSLLGVIQSNLADGPVYFNCYPNFSVDINDPNIMDVLTLNVKTKNMNSKENTREITIIYRVYYRLMGTTLAPKARFTSPKGVTTLMEANKDRSTIFVPKALVWDDILHSNDWHFEAITQPIRLYSEKSEIERVIQHPNGSIDLKFLGLDPSRHSSSRRSLSTRASTSKPPESVDHERNEDKGRVRGVDYSGPIPKV